MASSPWGSIRATLPFWPARLLNRRPERFPLPASAEAPTTLAGIRKSPWWSLRSRLSKIRQAPKDSEVESVQPNLLQLKPWPRRRREEIFSALSPLPEDSRWPRHPQRPSTLPITNPGHQRRMAELHGDAPWLCDQALVGGHRQEIGDQPVVLSAPERTGHQRRMWPVIFGMASQPGRLSRPCVLNGPWPIGFSAAQILKLQSISPAPYAVLLAEEQGQGEAIARQIPAGDVSPAGSGHRHL